MKQDAAVGYAFLVVDDHPEAGRGLVEYLLLRGQRATLAQCADEAEALVKAAPADGRPDVLITDLGLPGRSGQDLARALRGSVPLLVALSGMEPSHPEYFDLCFVKPCRVRHLVDQILGRLAKLREKPQDKIC